jgi:hypothetical protein
MYAKLPQHLAYKLAILALTHQHGKTRVAIQVHKIQHAAVPERQHNRLPALPYTALKVPLYMDWSQGRIEPLEQPTGHSDDTGHR